MSKKMSKKSEADSVPETMLLNISVGLNAMI